MFAENVSYNSALAARNGKRRHVIIGRLGGVKVRSEEVLARLRDKNIELSLMTLTRYGNSGVIPGPKMTNLGRGGGRAKDWPEETPGQAYAAYKMLNGQADDGDIKFSSRGVVRARAEALRAIEEKDFDAKFDLSVLVWLRFVGEYYDKDASSAEVEFHNEWGRRICAPILEWMDALEKRTPKEQAQQRIKDMEELAEWKKMNCKE